MKVLENPSFELNLIKLSGNVMYMHHMKKSLKCISVRQQVHTKKNYLKKTVKKYSCKGYDLKSSEQVNET